MDIELKFPLDSLWRGGNFFDILLNQNNLPRTSEILKFENSKQKNNIYMI